MKALILAAGLGSRLKSYTANLPKAMVKVNGEAIIDYQLAALKENGIENIVLVLGYQGEVLKRYLLQQYQSQFSFQFYDNLNYQNTNSAYSFYQAREGVAHQAYLHLNCDNIFSSEVIEQLLNSPADDAIIVDRGVDLKDNMEQVEVNNHIITHMQNTFNPLAIGKAMGIAKISPSLCDWLIARISKSIAENQLDENFYGKLREAVPLFNLQAVEVNEAIYEVNTVEDLHGVLPLSA